MTDEHAAADDAGIANPGDVIRDWANDALAAWKGSTTPPMWELARELRIDESLLRPLIAAVPELWLGNHILSKRRQEFVELWHLTDPRRVAELEGVLTCHALSPMGDTVELLADLGRTARIAAALGKRVTVLLADQEWSKYNRVVSDYAAVTNLDDNEQFRVNLYRSLGFTVKECNPKNADSIGAEEIAESARQYAELAEALLGVDVVQRTVTNDDLTQIPTDDNEPYTVDKQGILHTKLALTRLKGDFDVIRMVGKHLRQLNRETFIYYLTQRYHQWSFANHLKVAVRSEQNFDGPFEELDMAAHRQQGISRAIYFREYVLAIKANEPQFVIPYYFPSGTLYSGPQTPMDDYRRSAMLLVDAENTEQFETVFSSMPWPHNARLFADVMSFIHFVTAPWDQRGTERQREEGATLPVARKFRSLIEKKIQELAPELLPSWKAHAKRPGVFCGTSLQWCELASSAWHREAIPPYYLLPYYWLAPERSASHRRAIALFAALVRLTAMHIKPPRPRWKVST